MSATLGQGMDPFEVFFRRSRQKALAARKPQPGDKIRRRAEAGTRELIGERDCLYESHAQPDTGEVTDDEGKQGLAELDAIIDRNQAVIKKAKGEN